MYKSQLFCWNNDWWNMCSINLMSQFPTHVSFEFLAQLSHSMLMQSLSVNLTLYTCTHVDVQRPLVEDGSIISIAFMFS